MTREEKIDWLCRLRSDLEFLMPKKQRAKFTQALTETISDLSALSESAENNGEWIYDMSINNWRCSKCGQTLPPTGYVGNADFMATYFKFCPNCRADMRGGDK